MRTYLILLRRELGSYFLSWTGYIVLAASLFLLGLSFIYLVVMFNGVPSEEPVIALFYQTVFYWFILLLVAPIVTIRTFALEKFTGTFETLMTAPVSDLGVVLAKYCASLLVYLLMWLPLLGQMLLVRHFAKDPSVVDWGMLASTFLGIVLLGMLFMAMGCFASSLTRSLIIAAMVAFLLEFSLFVLSFLSVGLRAAQVFTQELKTVASLQGFLMKLLQPFSVLDHMRDFTRGVVDTQQLVFYLSLTVFFLFLTLKAVESRRWR
jgi:ABC-2 type transport system permease protein